MTTGVLVVGSANADLVVQVDRHPAPGETVLGSDLRVHPGGKGANQAVAAARLGARVGLVGRIGTDAHGDLLVGSLVREGVDTSTVLRDDAPTGVALIAVGSTGENSIVVSPGANARVTDADVKDAVRGASGWARVVSAQLEIPRAAVVAAAAVAEEQGMRFVLNPSPPDPLLDPDFAGPVLPRCDPLVVNEHEARMLLGAASADDPAPLADGLLRTGVRSAVVTLGARGAVVAQRAGGTRHVPGVPVEAVDTTGAGDAFTGALAWRLSQDPDLVAAVQWAVRVGAAAVRGLGAQSAYPRPEDLP
ncbi:ribokinase [Wenjunlia vitaminophila]|uniref:Ribokinase n=1 Tax=Wenjunlia vitaminophila TaxID=76728 RepID=A0A0T6LN07_WENVI|nr:ribokinase [Wenjunlia vitaminophila]